MTNFKDWVGIIVIFLVLLVALAMYGGLILGLLRNRLLVGPKLVYLATFTFVNVYVSRIFAYSGERVGIFDIFLGLVLAAIIFVISYVFVSRTHLDDNSRESDATSPEGLDEVSRLALKEAREIQTVVVAVILEIAFNAYNITIHL